MKRFTLHAGDCLTILAGQPADSFDAIVTDPPYGTEFMGQRWDAGVPGADYWQAALRVAKPGAHLLAFGGTRTFHRLACAIEDAGWELRDTIMWVYANGFPKNGAALKPAWEPILLCRKPLVGTLRQNVRRFGTGALNIDACRIGLNGEDQPTGSGNRTNGNIYAQDEWTKTQMDNGGNTTPSQGRWPANLIHDGSAEVIELFPEQSGGGTPRRRLSDKFRNTYGAFKGNGTESGIGASAGNAARFFYCAKASKRDREEGLDTEVLVKLRDDLTPKKRASVLAELKKAGVVPR